MKAQSKASAREKRLTPQRETILRVIRERHDHPTANEIFEGARTILPGISYATVYNSLRYLKDEGLVREIKFGDAASRYDGVTERHDHAICTRCGKLVDFEFTQAADLMRVAARKSHFKAESIHITLKGLCPDCAKLNRT